MTRVFKLTNVHIRVVILLKVWCFKITVQSCFKTLQNVLKYLNKLLRYDFLLIHIDRWMEEYLCFIFLCSVFLYFIFWVKHDWIIKSLFFNILDHQSKDVSVSLCVYHFDVNICVNYIFKTFFEDIIYNFHVQYLYLNSFLLSHHRFCPLHLMVFWKAAIARKMWLK